uniref:Uncharacterized protein n=3 Tax=Ixodes TaxID=6944 RepID=V5ICH7_IXORI
MIRRLVSSGAMLDYVDASSLLYRLQLGADVKEDLKSRWPCVWNAAKPHLNDRILVFNQLHFLMACLGVGASTDQLLAMPTSDVSGKVEDDGWPADQQLAASQVGLPVMKAMVAHSEGRFGDAAEQLAAVRYDVLRIGGSDAQRDVFDLLLLDSAMRSDRHNHLAEALLAERSIARPKSPMLQTMAETFSRRRGPAS